MSKVNRASLELDSPYGLDKYRNAPIHVENCMSLWVSWVNTIAEESLGRFFTFRHFQSGARVESMYKIFEPSFLKVLDKQFSEQLHLHETSNIYYIERPVSLNTVNARTTMESEMFVLGMDFCGYDEGLYDYAFNNVQKAISLEKNIFDNFKINSYKTLDLFE